MTKTHRVLDAGHKVLDSILANLAKQTAPGGKLSIDALDQHQLTAYDAAYIAAQLQAAEALWEFAMTQPEDSFERDLAEYFLADTLNEINGRVGLRFSDFGISTEFLNQTLWSKESAAFLNRILSEANLNRLAGKIRLPVYGLSSDHEEIRSLFKKFAESKIMPIAEHIHRHDADIPAEIIKELAEMGCFGLSIPQKYGGFQDDQKGDNTAMVVATEELSRGSLGAAGSLVTRPEILAKALLKGGTQEQKDKWLPLIASGEKMVTVGVTEPDYGSDVGSIIVKAEPKDGGWVINGSKLWCTFAGRADTMMILARTDPDRSKKYKGLSVFIVEKPQFSGHKFDYVQDFSSHKSPSHPFTPSPGRISGKAIPCIGYRGMHTFEVVFNNYWVPEENLIGGKAGLGQGFYLQMEGFAGGRLQTAARANGVSQAAIEQGLQYAQARKVFGKAIVNYQLMQVKLIKSMAALSASRQLSYKVAKLFDEHKGQMEASLVKLFASRISEWITREMVQIHGAMGYSEETAVSRYFVDARVFSIFEGAEEILALRVIAKSLIEQTLTRTHPKNTSLK